MIRAFSRMCAVALVCVSAGLALADGGYFPPILSNAGDLAQTRQEVVLVIQRDAADESLNQVTYVIRSHYAGTPTDLAWVIPLPATPANVVAHPDSALFEDLNQSTAPAFQIGYTGSTGMPCGCAAAPLAGGDGANGGGLVKVEDRGTAGVFEWAALSSTGSDALLTWLNDNGFAVSSKAGEVLDAYVQQDFHFLALRVNQPQTLTAASGEIDIPPIQFTCRTANYFYPMTISQVSAADSAEVVIYTLAAHRMEADNLPNAAIDRDSLLYQADSPSQTNYESLFAQSIADRDGKALITEFAARTDDRRFWAPADWPAAPAGVLDLPFLTRLRTVIARDKMDQDFELRRAAKDLELDRYYYLTRDRLASAAGALAYPAAALAGYAAFQGTVKRRIRNRVDREATPTLRA